MYTSRIVGVGDYQGCPLVSFTLASQSLPQRELRILPKDEKHPEDKRVYAFPRAGFEMWQALAYPEVDNYACIVPDKNRQGLWAVVFNGHMAKRVSSNIRAGIPPNVALDLTLTDFQGARNDARIGGVAYLQPERTPILFLGINNTDTGDKRVRGYPNDQIKEVRNKLFFVYDKNTNIESCFEFSVSDLSPNQLAEHIHRNIIGEEIMFGLGTGIAILREGDFHLGLYNNPFNGEDIQRWREEYKQANH